MQRQFTQVDVFTDQATRGNPLAVILSSEGLDTRTMLAFTRWTNLSEATFVIPATDPRADYAVRIFCPTGELPFAGHPTLGTCHAWLLAGGRPKSSTADSDVIVQECGVGLVPIKRSQGRLAFAAPPLRKAGPLPEHDVAIIAAGLGIARHDIVAHAWCDNGPNWRGVLLASASQVLAIKPNSQLLDGLDVGVIGPKRKVGVIAALRPGAPGAAAVAADAASTADVDADAEAAAAADFEVRAFFPGTQGMTEDPVTGSLNAGLAQWLIGAGLAPKTYVAAQGTALGRRGRVYVETQGDTIWLGGHTVTVVDGTIEL